MKKSNRSFKALALMVVAIFTFFSTTAMAQPKPYYGPLLYSMPRDTSVPPLYAGQPAQVTTGYLWLDDVMRLYPEYQIENFFNSLAWNDTMKTFASILYQTQDNNPLSLFLWSGTALHPNPYKGVSGQAQVAFEKKVSQIAGDTGRTSSLLTADVISDIVINDTLCSTETSGSLSIDMVFVNATILDEIKGKKIPLCVGEEMRGKKMKGATAQSGGTVTWASYPVPADSGTCLQFEYSPEWSLTRNDDEGRTLMIDTSGGWWIKPGKEYIVFLNFLGVSSDNTRFYFTLRPGMASIGNGGMYPVIDGIVQDPGDDYGIGASAGLTVAVWKSRIRARISAIITP